MSTERILITGANRGIGLSLVSGYLDKGTMVFATTRQMAVGSRLSELTAQFPDQLVQVVLDVTDQEQIEAAVLAVSKQVDALDIAINNAGWLRRENFSTVTAEMLRTAFEVNAIAPLMVSKAFHGLLKGGQNPRLVNISSGMGSLERTRSGGHYSYKASKAALNMLSRINAFELSGDRITIAMVHPGWVRTDMGGKEADFSSEESAAGIIEVVAGLTFEDSGCFVSWEGETIPW